MIFISKKREIIRYNKTYIKIVIIDNN